MELVNRRTALGLAGAGVLLAATRGGIAAPIAIVDAAGRTITLERPARRVVVLFNYEEFLAVVGSEGFDRVSGYSKTVWYDWRRSIWDKYAASVPGIRSVTDVGYSGDGTFSVEKIITLRPDVVIMPRWAFVSLQTAVDQLESSGIKTVVIDYNAMRTETHVASTLAIGKVMGTEARAEEIANLYKSKVDDVEARVGRANRPRPKIYVELGHKGPDEYDSSFSQDQWGPLVERAGGNNIAKGKITSEALLGAEYVLATNPDFIFIAGSTWTGALKAVDMGFGVDKSTTNGRLKPYLDRPGWAGLNAVRNGHVYAIHHGIARTLFDFAGMQFIAKAMYPDLFVDIDPEASLRTFFKAYLPVQYEGTWMMQLQR